MCNAEERLEHIEEELQQAIDLLEEIKQLLLTDTPATLGSDVYNARITSWIAKYSQTSADNVWRD